jgi:hypothetical protein
MSREIKDQDKSKMSQEDLQYLADRALLSADEERDLLGVGKVQRPPEPQLSPEEEAKAQASRISSNYNAYTKEDLAKEAKARGYEVDKGATKTELMRALQEDDRSQSVTGGGEQV